MTVAPPSVSSETYSVLEQIDVATGAHTQEAYESALAIAPHLGEFAVRRDDTAGPHFTRHPDGLTSSELVVNGDPEFYRTAVRSGMVANRMGEFRNFYYSLGIKPRLPELVTAVALHELGHGDDYHGYIESAGGDTKAAFAMAKSVRDSQLATLPLRAVTSRAEKAWVNNTEGYRDKIRAMGWTDEKWEAQKLENTTAYTKLSCENVADRFALGVLATIYPR
jgi:hypothetical protein